ncbi:MAG: hypothetical protein JWQ40_1039 [Segetibacter sp.]|jgi:hypothetical protein|nr:hypothetical protein [Segetibacter sp.]
MQQTFFRSINGHRFEFNRLLYPISYHISTRDGEIEGGTFSAVKDEEGLWNLMQHEDLPGWVNELSVDIKEAIVENEEIAI